MNDAPSPSADRAISCAIVAAILCLTLLALAVLVVSAAS